MLSALGLLLVAGVLAVECVQLVGQRGLVLLQRTDVRGEEGCMLLLSAELLLCMGELELEVRNAAPSVTTWVEGSKRSLLPSVSGCCCCCCWRCRLSCPLLLLLRLLGGRRVAEECGFFNGKFVAWWRDDGTVGCTSLCSMACSIAEACWALLSRSATMFSLSASRLLPSPEFDR